MVECYIEIFQEEIPARMQPKAAEILRTAFAAKLKETQLDFRSMFCCATPLRLVLQIEGLQEVQQDRCLETKGPLLSAPAKAIEGFLKSNGLDTVDCCNRLDTPKGEALLYRRTIIGQTTQALLPEMLASILREFNWPKTMRFADDDFRWIRPLRQVIAVLDGVVQDAELTLGSRILRLSSELVLDRFAPRKCAVPNTFAAYQDLMNQEGVILTTTDREAEIERQLLQLAAENGCVWHKDQGLLNEVSGLTEQPIALLGKIEARFMDLPDAVLRLAMKVHQKYFVFHSANGLGLSGHFVVITAQSNPVTHQTILDGNLRVLRSRLQDAEFFLLQDQRIALQEHGSGLKDLRFVEGLGSMHDKVQRIALLLQQKPIQLSAIDAEELALLAKADLVSEMVGEFPELQGMIGGYYAEAQNIAADKCLAVHEHYAPKGPSDAIPESLLGAALAMMDKLDTIAGFASKDALPKGSGDAFAIRRAMLGVLRIMIDRGWLGYLPELFVQALSGFGCNTESAQYKKLMGFYRGRMVQYLRDQDIEHGIALAAMDGDPAEILQTAQALTAFLLDDTGQALKASYVRAQGILKKSDAFESLAMLPMDALERADKNLWNAVQQVDAVLSKLQSSTERLESLSQLSLPLNNFFDAVLINTEDSIIKNARLNILRAVVDCVQRVANFDRLISG